MTTTTPTGNADVRPIVHAHENDFFAQRFLPHHWQQWSVRTHASGTWRSPNEPPERIETRPHLVCSYCGSITPEHFLAALERAGTQYSGSDWKYGWPHKFYLTIPCAPYTTAVAYNYSEDNEGRRVTEVIDGKRTTDHCKFYATHLRDASPDLMERWRRIATPLLGVHFHFNADGLLAYAAPWHAWQTWGVVGEGAGEHAPRIPQTFLSAVGLDSGNGGGRGEQ